MTCRVCKFRCLENEKTKEIVAADCIYCGKSATKEQLERLNEENYEVDDE